MSKIIDLKLFENVTITLFAVIVLAVSDTAWAQNSVTGYQYIDARVNGGHIEVGVQSEFFHPPNDLETHWNSIPIPFLVMTALDVPIAKTMGLPSGVTALTAAHINALWDGVYKGSDGWDRGNRTATTSYNCHGHSTQRIHWMDIGEVLANDYVERTTAEYICVGAIYGNFGHTGRISGVSTLLTGGVPTANAIFKISEKFQASAIYEREFQMPNHYTMDELMPIVGSPFFGQGTNGLSIPDSLFYVPKK